MGSAANHNDGTWIAKALATTTDDVLVDITGISGQATFGTLDAFAGSGKMAYIGYTEAKEYWPKETDWKRLRKNLKTHETLAELVDKQPWLFGYEHQVDLVPGHEGYDASGTGRALVSFLPYKCARLGAVLGTEGTAREGKGPARGEA